MNIGDRVTFDDEEAPDITGVLVVPTAEEIAYSKTWPYPPLTDEVLVEWNDGERSWQHPHDLQVQR